MAFVLRALARNNDRVHGVVDENMNWDLNEDSKLNKEEMRAMKRADKAKYLRFIKADKDGDRVLDEDELQVAEEGERKYQSILRLRKLKAILKNRLNQRSAYWAFMFYTAFLEMARLTSDRLTMAPSTSSNSFRPSPSSPGVRGRRWR